MAVDEVLVIDDGTEDEQDLVALRDVRQRFSGVTVVTQANSGPAGARNRGLDIASGEYVVFVDADDQLREDCIEDRFARIHDDPTLAAVYSGYAVIGEESDDRHSSFANLEPQLPTASQIGRAGGFPGGLPLFMFRRASLLEIGGLDQTLTIMEDFDAIIRLLRLGKPIAGSNLPTYLRRRRSNSHSRSHSLSRLAAALRFLRKARLEGYFPFPELSRRYVLTVLEFLRR